MTPQESEMLWFLSLIERHEPLSQGKAQKLGYEGIKQLIRDERLRQEGHDPAQLSPEDAITELHRTNQVKIKAQNVKFLDRSMHEEIFLSPTGRQELRSLRDIEAKERDPIERFKGRHPVLYRVLELGALPLVALLAGEWHLRAKAMKWLHGALGF